MTLATLHLAWEELEMLAQLVESRLPLCDPEGPTWAKCNALRTALREAQATLPVDFRGMAVGNVFSMDYPAIERDDC